MTTWTCRLFIRTNSNRRRFKDWHGSNGIVSATEYAECLPAGYEADLYTYDPATQRLTYTRTIYPKP